MLFSKKSKIVIGAVHLPPLVGYSDYPGIDVAIENALIDLKNFQDGGADAVIFENNYDIPHTEFVTPKIKDAMIEIGKALKKESRIPLGVSVLWNDYKSALDIAKTLGLSFIRVPVFVDSVESQYGKVIGDAHAVVEYRASIDGKDILLLTDIHVKHSKLISTHSLVESAKLAMESGSDALILTGRWTGESPDVTRVEMVRKSVGTFPILIGSGIDEKNIIPLFAFADGAIVSTSVKLGPSNTDKINVKGYSQRISKEKVLQLMSKLTDIA